MSKKVPVYLSQEELVIIKDALSNQEDLTDTPAGWNEMLERVEAELETFEETPMYKEDEDGYETLTDEAREGLRENEAWLRSGE